MLIKDAVQMRDLLQEILDWSGCSVEQDIRIDDLLERVRRD